MKLLACARNGNAAPALMYALRGIEYDAQRCGAHQGGEAKVENDENDVVVRCNVEPLANLF